MKIKNIIDGWKNYLIDDPVVDELAKKRAEICSGCPSAKTGVFSAVLKDYKLHAIEGHFCDECGCPLSAKVRSKISKCDLGKW